MAAVAAFVALVAAGCGATVHSSIAPNANLAQYHTFALQPPIHPAGVSASPAEAALQSALRNDLAQKGLTEAAPGQAPDFLVAYHVKTQEKLDVQNYGYGYGYGWGRGWGGPASVSTYTEGTLIVDFIDPRTNTSFWRGTASDIVNHPESPDIGKLDKAVAKLVDQYPAMMASTSRPTM